MFEATQLNAKNDKKQFLVKVLFLMMTLLLILPVLIILSVLIYKGGPVISFDFLFGDPKNGMTEGGIMPALLGTAAPRADGAASSASRGASTLSAEVPRSDLM